MRRLVAALVLVVAAFVVATDAYACADGCTDDPPGAASHTVSECTVCQRGMELRPVDVPAPAMTVETLRTPLILAPVLPAVLRTIDHPPRLA